jgi:acyl-CoA synthetase (AMP-forming)/AMP-acid ligase II
MMKFNAEEALSLIEKRQVSLLIGVPLLYRKLMQAERFKSADLSSLTNAFVGGDNVPPSLLTDFDEEMKKRHVDCRLLEGYGLTETVTVCAVNTKKCRRPDSVGRPLPGIELLIADESLTPLGEKEIGEVLIGGDTLMTEYRRDFEATEKTLITLGGKTYVRSGDLGLLTDGFLTLKGRKKRMFKISGMNIYPAEIERLATDLAPIADASLEFFEEPSPHTVLFLIKGRDAKGSEEEIKARLSSLFEEKLLKYAHPRAIVFLSEFPKTAIGKIRHGDFTHP